VLNGKNKLLIIAALFSASAAIVHLGCIIFGANWYRFFGAGEQMAQLAEQGHWYPTVVTSVIFIILSIWSLYGLSGAKVIRQLPLIRLVLIIISSIFIIRGLAFYWLMPMFPENSFTFWLTSSGICLTIGSLYAAGTFQTWSQLGKKDA
jgi:hypothetical protein